MSGARPVMSLCQSLMTKAEALLNVVMKMEAFPTAAVFVAHLVHLGSRRGLRIPFDLRILRILFPATSSQHAFSPTSTTEM